MPIRFMVLLSLVGCAPTVVPAPTVAEVEIPKPVSRAKAPPKEPPPTAKNFVFSDAPNDPARVPTVRAVEWPLFHAAASVWGSTGRDHRGRIYFGVSCDGAENLSAHLFEFDPETGQSIDIGGVIENLTRLNLAKPGIEQNKIHTKILQAADGCIYFASLDEGGENEDGSKLPTHGSHLWRRKPVADAEWEHIDEVREAVIASAVGGRFVYFLGYFGHVLYQVDTATGKVANSVRVGSVGGHTTRNFIADSRGHVFIPRPKVEGTKTIVSLIEYDAQLQEIAAFPIAHYGTSPDASSHGIVGVTPLKNDSYAFVTDRGRLYRIDPRDTGTAFADLGWFHPDGESYTPSLFTYDGETTLCGIGKRGADAGYEWLSFDLRTKLATAKTIVIPIPVANTKGLLIYGSTTRDDEGRFYVGGRYIIPGNPDLSTPAIWQLTP